MLRPVRALAVAMVVAAVAVPATAVADDLEDELRRVSRRIEAVARLIDDVAASRSNLAAEILVAQQELETLVADLDASEAALDDIQDVVGVQADDLERVRGDLRSAYVGIARTRNEMVDQRAAAIKGARAAYIHGGRELTAWSMSAETVTGISIGAEYLERVSRANAAAMAALFVLEEQEQRQQISISNQETEVAGDLARLELLEGDLGAAHGAIASQREELAASLVLQAHLLETLDEEIARFESELDGLESEQGRIKRRIAAEQASRLASVSSSGFVRPVPGAVTSAFGPRYHPVLGYSRNHTGVDMAAGHGQPIKAARSGTVILAATWGGYGRTIVIDHGGGVSTLYAHQASLNVSYGDTVEAGEVIGKVGTSGLSTGPHLHFEVRLGGDPVDPAPYLNG